MTDRIPRSFSEFWKHYRLMDDSRVDFAERWSDGKVIGTILVWYTGRAYWKIGNACGEASNLQDAAERIDSLLRRGLVES